MRVKLFFTCLFLAVAGTAWGSSVILNEYNAVKGSEYLKNNGSDTYWGHVKGNGGDWFEMVVITDHLDMRKWRLDIYEDGSKSNTLKLTDASIWSDLRSGTIITVSEDLADDVSYNPAAGDWWINVQANDNASGTYIEAESFPVNEKDWQLVIKDADKNVVFGPAGEGVKPTSGVGSTEVCKLEENPSSSITPLSNYNDGSSSTFGAPNKWGGGAYEQDFSTLRSVVPEPLSAALLAIGGLISLRCRKKGHNKLN